MSKEIVIQASKKETRIAILEDGKLVELYVENPENARTIGDIYLGRVRNVMPSIQAAFVNIGQKQDAFLHFSDVGETLVELLGMIGEDAQASDIDVHVPRVHRSIRNSNEYDSSPSKKSDDKKGKAKGKKTEYIHPARYLRNGERILVQIVKEPISSKGSRITSHVTLAGRFLVLVPFGDYVAVSKKIWSARERKRLQTLGRSLLPDGFGLIIRTVAAGKDAKTLHTDLSLLVDKWSRINEKLDAKPSPPKLLHQDVSMVSSVIRDLFTNDYDRILIDDHRLFKSIQTYIRAVAPGMLEAIQHHDSERPVFEEVGADKAIAEAFSSRVDLPSGGYVIIEHTEAMHVIDVNSGRAGKGESQEDNSLKVDLEAASTIAHQLRLRDLGGIIVVDFIDLREDKNRNKVVNRLKQEFRKDRAVTKVLPMSDFGLIQITRQRLRPSITTDEAAREAEHASAAAEPVGDATEQLMAATIEPVRSVNSVVKKLDQDLAANRKNSQGHINLTVHPFFAAFLKKGIPSRLNRLRLKHRVKITLHERDDQLPTEYSFDGQNLRAHQADSGDASVSGGQREKKGSPEKSGEAEKQRRPAEPRSASGRNDAKDAGNAKDSSDRSASSRESGNRGGRRRPQGSRSGGNRGRQQKSGENGSANKQEDAKDSGQSNEGNQGNRSRGGRNQSRRGGRNRGRGNRGNRGNRGGRQKQEATSDESQS